MILSFIHYFYLCFDTTMASDTKTLAYPLRVMYYSVLVGSIHITGYYYPVSHESPIQDAVTYSPSQAIQGKPPLKGVSLRNSSLGLPSPSSYVSYTTSTPVTARPSLWRKLASDTFQYVVRRQAQTPSEVVLRPRKVLGGVIILSLRIALQTYYYHHTLP